jgi:3-hydroxymyristoyl/3-hydroxydecanoyl-(acyl carrier protein) dehydratase
LNREVIQNIEEETWPLQNDWPQVEFKRRVSPHQFELTLFVPPQTTWFSGHFPAHPVLPGVVQLHWASRFANLLWPELDDFESVENLKFRKLVLPGMRLKLELEYDHVKNRVQFSFRHEDEVCSGGRISYHQEMQK